jgi:uncharacterized protein (DUF2235 family)
MIKPLTTIVVLLGRKAAREIEHSRRGTLTSDNSSLGVRRCWIMPKNIVLCCDGANNEVIGNQTNVLRVSRMRAITASVNSARGCSLAA